MTSFLAPYAGGNDQPGMCCSRGRRRVPPAVFTESNALGKLALVLGGRVADYGFEIVDEMSHFANGERG